MKDSNKGPLKDGQTVAIIGGGPAGCSCALRLVRRAEKKNINLNIKIFEHKHYGSHYNQCLGVLSPPLLEMLEDYFGVELPDEILQRKIEGYTLYTLNTKLDLPEELNEKCSYAVRRVEFDKYFLNETLDSGVEMDQSRVTDIEILDDRVVIYSESGNYEADVVVGAYGLDAAMEETFVRRGKYEPAPFLEAIVGKIHPSEEFLEGYDNKIKSFILPFPRIEFAAVTPKANHLSIIIAGKNVTSTDFRNLITKEPIKSVLPENAEVPDVYKGFFPNGPARNFYSDRFVLIGDAAGLIRPFKGKGINSAVITGKLAADTMIDEGISQKAFKSFESACGFLIEDYWYGAFVRYTAKILSRFHGLDPILEYARRNDEIKNALYKSVSATDTYKNVLRTCFKPGNLAGVIASFPRYFLGL